MSAKKKKYTVWVRRDHLFSVILPAESLEEALAKAKEMNIDQLVDAPGETVDDEHRFTLVME